MQQVDSLSYEDKQEEISQQDQPEKKGSILDEKDLKGMTDNEKGRAARGESIREMKRQAQETQRQAVDLIRMATSKKRMTSTEAKLYEDRLKETRSSPEKSEEVLEEIQKKLAGIEVSRKTDSNIELEKDDPDILKAYDKYDQLIDDNEDILGTSAAKEYKAWIREQKPNLLVLQDLTIKFLQSERPPRAQTLDKLKSTLGKYGVDPMDIAYLKEQGLSERKAFLKNIEEGEKHFQKMGGMQEQLYSREAKQNIMTQVCSAKTPEDQAKILQQLSIIAREEAKGYTTLKSGVQGQKMSQKSMDYILNYHKEVTDLGKRANDMRYWETFVSNEAKLADDLKEVFDQAPPNKEGFQLAFRIFKDLDYTEKEEFIQQMKEKREKEQSEEEINKELVVKGFKHSCTQAVSKKIISESTEKNYHDWIDENAKDKKLDDIKKFYDILTSQTPNEQYKNLKAYENRRKKFQEDLNRLKELNPTLKGDEVNEWQTKYDEEGWRKRETVHKDLKKEIQKAQESRMGRLNKLNPKLLKDIQEDDETNNAKTIENKKTALSAIRDLMDLKAYGTAMKHCVKLLKTNPEDKDVIALMDELAQHADQGKIVAEKDKEKEIYETYADIAQKQIDNDKETHMDAVEVQVHERALLLARKDQEKRQTVSAHDRNKSEILEKIGHDEVLTEMVESYTEDSGENEILDVNTLSGKESAWTDFQTEDTHEEKMLLRKEIYDEQSHAESHGGGSSAVEFMNVKTGKILDARVGMSAEKEQQGMKEDLAEEMAQDIAGMADASGLDENTDHLELARKAALDRIQKKADTKLDRSAA